MNERDRMPDMNIGAATVESFLYEAPRKEKRPFPELNPVLAFKIPVELEAPATRVASVRSFIRGEGKEVPAAVAEVIRRDYLSNAEKGKISQKTKGIVGAAAATALMVGSLLSAFWDKF